MGTPSITGENGSIAGVTGPTRPIYVVLGMHRSGTSLCSSILNMLGIDMTEEEGPGVGNEAGHWERWPLVALQDEVLASFNRTYYSSSHDFSLPLGWWTRPHLRPIIRRMKDYLAVIADESRLFGFKDPRTTKLLPMWKRIFRDAGLEPFYIVCLRNPSHVAASLHRRDNLPSDVGEMRALDYLVNAVAHTNGCRRHFIRYEEWFEDFAGTFERLTEFLHLKDISDSREILQAVQASVKPQMNHGAAAEPQPRQPLVKHFYSLVEQLVDCVEGADQKVKSFIDSYTAFQQLVAPFETLQREQAASSEQLQLVVTERDAEIARVEQRAAVAEQAIAALENGAIAARQVIQALEEERVRLAQECEAAQGQAAEQRQQVQAAAAHIRHLEGVLQHEREQAEESLRQRGTLEQRLTTLHDSLADQHSAYKLLEQRLVDHSVSG